MNEDKIFSNFDIKIIMPIINITQIRRILYVWKFAVPIVLIHCTIKIASNNITSFFQNDGTIL